MPELIRLRSKVDDAARFADGIARIRAELNRRGFDADPREIALAYSEWSEDHYSAGWMVLPADLTFAGSIADVIAGFMEEIPPGEDRPLIDPRVAAVEALGACPSIRSVNSQLDAGYGLVNFTPN